jgi:hypothetical protein
MNINDTVHKYITELNTKMDNKYNAYDHVLKDISGYTNSKQLETARKEMVNWHNMYDDIKSYLGLKKQHQLIAKKLKEK